MPARLALPLLLVTLAALPATAQTLTGAEWHVVDLAGTAPTPAAAPTLTFTADGKVSGHSGCNRFTGGWAQDGLQLTFTAMAGTRMACEAPRMEVEAAMLRAFEGVTTLALTPGGALELLGADGLLIRAVR